MIWRDFARGGVNWQEDSSIEFKMFQPEQNLHVVPGFMNMLHKLAEIWGKRERLEGNNWSSVRGWAEHKHTGTLPHTVSGPLLASFQLTSVQFVLYISCSGQINADCRWSSGPIHVNDARWTFASLSVWTHLKEQAGGWILTGAMLILDALLILVVIFKNQTLKYDYTERRTHPEVARWADRVSSNTYWQVCVGMSLCSEVKLAVWVRTGSTKHRHSAAGASNNPCNSHS